ncbi:magnesium transporter MgtE N-terminal domain-containing protein, partial [Mycolicibacterium holsaticum]|uniref:magnesium transporter MgtE N-terminal domain-containing protein n=1 Tax=Mycolicibacterium holsaticum TaxID=152142 RepID=UPI003B8A8484
MSAERVKTIERALGVTDLAEVTSAVRALTPSEVVDVLERQDSTDRAVLYRLLAKDQALRVFEALDPSLQSDLVRALPAIGQVPMSVMQSAGSGGPLKSVTELPQQMLGQL